MDMHLSMLLKSIDQADKEVVLADHVKQNGKNGMLPKNFKEIVLAAVQSDGYALEYAADSFNDKEVVLAAVKQNGEALKYAAEELDQSPIKK